MFLFKNILLKFYVQNQQNKKTLEVHNNKIKTLGLAIKKIMKLLKKLLVKFKKRPEEFLKLVK